jgi:hypothetical protein
MKKFCVLVFAVSGLVVGTAYGDKPKGYSVTLTEGKIGASDFDRGEYKVLIHRDEMKAELMDVRTGDMFDVTGKVETADSKFEHTEVYSRNVDGVKQITEIRIGGTPFRVDFRGASAQ